MSKKQITYLLTFLFAMGVALVINVAVYFLATRQGNNGITLQLFGGGDDGAFYWEQIQKILRGLPWIRTSIFPLLSSYVIRLTGVNDVFMIRLFNLVGYFVLLLFSTKIIELLFLEEETHLSNAGAQSLYNAKSLLLIIFTIYLSLQMNVHISILRDIWIYALYVISLYYILKININRDWIVFNGFILLVSLYLLGQFRGYILVSFLFATMVVYLYRTLKANDRLWLFLGIVGIIFIFYYTFLIDFKVPIVDKSLRDGLEYRFSAIEYIEAGSQMDINLITSNFILFIFRYIHSYLGNLIGPLPWHISGFSTLIVFFVESIPMVVLLWYIYKQRRYMDYQDGILFIHALVWNGFIAFSNDNVGTATRLRPISWILFVIIFINILIKKKRHTRESELNQA
ncbi:hypothetical protein HZY86_01755 [Aerococcaceae bacterium DSM 111020]|nr:hypothetical protein [Aerococcaceae bacterium DSM 111020]